MLLSKFYFDLGKIRLPGLWKVDVEVFLCSFIVWVIRKPFVSVSFGFAQSDLASLGPEWGGGKGQPQCCRSGCCFSLEEQMAALSVFQVSFQLRC